MHRQVIAAIPQRDIFTSNLYLSSNPFFLSTLDMIVILIPLTLLIAVLGGFLLLNLYIYWIRSEYRQFNSIPVSPGLTWFLGCLLELKEFFLENHTLFAGRAFHKYQEQYGWDLFCVPIFNRNAIYCMDLDLLPQVVNDFRTFPKDKQTNEIFAYIRGQRLSGPHGLIRDIGSEMWYSKRKAIDPAFHKSFLKSIIPGMNNAVENTLRRIDSKCRDGQKEFDMAIDLTQAAFESIAYCGFGWNTEYLENQGEYVRNTMPRVFEAMSDHYKYLLFRFKSETYEETIRVMKEKGPAIRADAKQYLLKRINDENAPKDILHHIIKANECSDVLGIENVVDDYLTLLMAGWDTSAIVMSNVFFFLSNNPEMFAKVRREVDSLVQRGEQLTFEQVGKLKYLETVIKESMRIAPPVRMLNRYCPSGSVLSGLKIPKGASILLPMYDIQTSGRFWKNPFEFDPDRFSPERKKDIVPFSYIPFLAGPRGCVAKHFAHMETKMIISRIVQEFDFENPDPSTTALSYTGMITAKPMHGVYLKVSQRKD